ncbi:phage tail-collar fiber domain-containing protein [Brevibacillus sp. JB24b]|uniref:phage tail-collar fiber domain-containing protein n=1 Tax=Brevibacillus sp. JB24b TaxID=3422308 RepID=UPI003F688279
MAQFNNPVLTEKGLSLLTKAQMGTPLTFTRVAVGDGNLFSSDLKELTKLINETESLPILELKKVKEGQIVIQAAITNEKMTTGSYLREIGVFALDPDEGEILYSVSHAGERADYLPPIDGGLNEIMIGIHIIIGEVANVTAEITQSVYVTMEQFKEHINDMSIHIRRSEYEHDINDLRARILLFEAALPENYKHNKFTIMFSTIDEINLLDGYYDSTLQRLVL